MAALALSTVSSGYSNTGRLRESNEDAFVADNDLQLYAVSDGMGGVVGEKASRLTIELMRKRMGQERALIDAVARGEQPPAELEEMLRLAVLATCSDVYDAARQNPVLAGMGATLTLLVIAGTHAVMAHVGHCRLYLMRGGKLSQLSTDHTLAAELGRADAPFQIEDEPTSGMLSRNIGMQPSVAADTLVLEVLPGDRFLLCTDGYSRYLQDEQALSKQLADAEPDTLARRMVQAANVAGGEDNITCVVVSLNSDEPDEKRSSRILERYNALSSVFLFEGLGLPLLARVVSRSQLPVHLAGEVVVAQGTHCEELMVVLEGEYDLLRGDLQVGTLRVGDHAGATLMFNPRAARSTIVARTGGRMLRLAGAELRKLLRERPWLGMGLLQRLGARLSADLDRSYAQREGSLERSYDGEHF